VAAAPNRKLLPALSLPLPAASAATVSAAAPFDFRASFVDVEGPAVKIGAIQSANRAFRFRGITHFHESESPGSPGIPVGYDADTLYRAVFFEQGSNGIFGGPETEISYKNVLHFILFLKFAEQRIAGRSDTDGEAGQCERCLN
jgi:hypothetical protein